MMLLMARAATWRLSTGLVGRRVMQVQRPGHLSALAGVIGSRPTRPVLALAKPGLSSLVSNANTQRIWRVCCPHAKLTWPGSALTSGSGMPG